MVFVVWQPIVTAPKDGTSVLTFTQGEMRVAQWFDGPAPSGAHYPTHWMPLPSPPQQHLGDIPSDATEVVGKANQVMQIAAGENAETTEGRSAVALGRKGGKAPAKKLTPERRTEIARRAAETRWAKEGLRKRSQG